MTIIKKNNKNVFQGMKDVFDDNVITLKLD